jgi:hypothetical protein
MNECEIKMSGFVSDDQIMSAGEGGARRELESRKNFFK